MVRAWRLMFWRASAELLFTTKSFGTGLGVPAIEQIAIQHGGRLEVQSVVGEGAVFTIFLPLVLAERMAG